MTILAGTTGRLLQVDLSRGEVRDDQISPALWMVMLGGSGVGSSLVYAQVPAQADPLESANELVFMTGPLTGTDFPAGACYAAVAKSPLSGTIYSKDSKGVWGQELKAAGYDGIIIRGKAAAPVYLSVHEGSAELRDATAVWGLGAPATQEKVKEDLRQPLARVISIGPAGERCARVASIVDDNSRSSVFGGLGAVMGSKSLKAIAVRGSQRVQVADEVTLRGLAQKVSTYSTSSRDLETLRTYGTAFGMELGLTTGEIPVQNWRMTDWDQGCLRLGGKRIRDTYRVPCTTCPGCPVRCRSMVEIPKGSYQGSGATPEYDALAAFGSLCLNENLESVCYANNVCDEYGMDPAAVGSAIAFVMEAGEKGLIGREDAGVDLTWGNPEAVVAVTELIAKGIGIGKVLGEGAKTASAEISGSAGFTLHLKGLPVPMKDPRAFFSLAVAYATGLAGDSSPFERFLVMPEAGIRHKQGRFDKKGKGLAAKVAQDYYSLASSAGFCPLMMPVVPPAIIAAALEAATGERYTSLQAMAVGERTATVQRLYANFCGISAADDTLPERLLTAAAAGPRSGRVPDLPVQLREYYELRGWDVEGRPTRQAIEGLRLEEVLWQSGVRKQRQEDDEGRSCRQT